MAIMFARQMISGVFEPRCSNVQWNKKRKRRARHPPYSSSSFPYPRHILLRDASPANHQGGTAELDQ
jgi:hypothetical protein